MNKNVESIEVLISKIAEGYGYTSYASSVAGVPPVIDRLPAIIVSPAEILECDGVVNCRITSEVQIMIVKSSLGCASMRSMELVADMRHDLVSMLVELQDCCNIIEVSELEIEVVEPTYVKGSVVQLSATAEVISNYNPQSSSKQVI